MVTRKSLAGVTPARKSATRAAPAKRLPAAPAKPAPSVGAAGASESAKPKQKLVRDSFTIPKNEYTVLGELKQRAARLARPAKKSELLRAGIKALGAMTDKTFLAALGAVPSLKTGRPKDAKTVPGKVAAKKA